MSKQEKRFNEWKNNSPIEADVDEVKSLIKALIGKECIKKSTGSHIKIQHERLKGIPDFGVDGRCHIPTKSGKKVKGIYIEKLIRVIEIIRED